MFCQEGFARLVAPNFKLTRNEEALLSSEAKSQPSTDSRHFPLEKLLIPI